MMNTEIKFKAKRNDKDKEEIFTLEDIANLRDDFYSYENWRQFSGRSDSRGADLYAGDIFQIDFAEYTYYVVFEEGRFIAYNIKNGNTFWGDIHLFEQKGFEIEIIGNIHEHPHLLK